MSQHIASFLRRRDVAVGDHRHSHRCLDCSNRVVFGLALVTLLPGAAMNRQHLYTSGLKQARQGHCVFVGFAPARAHLQRHRHAARQAGANYRLDNCQGQRFVLHQRRSGPFVADLLGGAAHVDVDDLCAAVYVVDSRFGHHQCIGTGNLYGNGRFFAVMIGAARGLQAVPQVASRSHHLADRITRPPGFAQAPERPVSDARHRRGKQGVCQNVGADIHGRAGWCLLKNEARL